MIFEIGVFQTPLAKTFYMNHLQRANRGGVTLCQRTNGKGMMMTMIVMMRKKMTIQMKTGNIPQFH